MRTVRTRLIALAMGVALLATACGSPRDNLQVGERGAATPTGARELDHSNPQIRLRDAAEHPVGELTPAGFNEGQPSQDLVYTPIAPCRLVDTRSASAIGGDLAANETRGFYVTNFDDPLDTQAAFADQGGNTDGCGMTFGIATSVIVNFTVVGAGGTGFLRAWAPGTPAPNATLVNYNPSLNISNGIAVPICDPYVIDCDTELNVKAFAARTNLVIDVVGYFSFSLPPSVVTPETTTLSADVDVVTNVTCTGYSAGQTAQELHPVWAGRILVDGHVTLAIAHLFGTEDRVEVFVGYNTTVDGSPTATSGCGQSPCTSATSAPAVVGAAQPTGNILLNVPVRCEILVTLADLGTVDTVYELHVNGRRIAGGTASADRVSFTSTFTPDLTAT